MEHFTFATYVAALVLAAAGGAFILFGKCWRSREGPLGLLRDGLLKLAVSMGTLLVLFLGIEIYFAGFYVESDGYGTTLAGKRWFELHWNPQNALGYRDRDHDWKDDQALLIVGDSFVAGHGVADAGKRMSGVLERGLGDGWQVGVVADVGWDPVQEFEALSAYPKKPSRIVVSYYINDIESAAKAHGNAPPTQLLKQPPKVVRWLVDQSYGVNWFYWRILRGQFGTVYWDWLKAAYEDPEVLAAHARELERFMAYSEEVGAQLDFIVWPNLDYIEGSRPFTDRIVALLLERGVSALDLGAHFSGRDPATLVVNAMDGHPNAATHAEVAKLLLGSW